MFPKDAEIDVPLVVKKLNEIVAARGVFYILFFFFSANVWMLCLNKKIW